MTPTVSICIPTLNRPALLIQSLNSIFCEPSLTPVIEICISNNASESNYSGVERLLRDNMRRCTIKYVRHDNRLPLDENHHFVKNMATADHLFFLGDDDFFLRDELPRLLELVKRAQPDLAIFNGYQISEDNDYVGQHFALAPRHYESLETAFADLKDKGSFGSVLVHRNHLQDADFQQLYQTDHAYGCYWLSLFRMHERGETPVILVPDFPCVALRAARKSYNHIDVYFKKIPHWMAVHQRSLASNPLNRLIDDHAAATSKANLSLRFLIHLASTGYDLRTIRQFDTAFHDQHWLRIWLAKRLAASYLLKAARRAYRLSAKKWVSPKAEIGSEQIVYKLSSASRAPH